MKYNTWEYISASESMGAFIYTFRNEEMAMTVRTIS